MSSIPANLPRLLKVSAIFVGALLGISGILLASRWPFNRDATLHSLERVSSSEVHIGRFRKLFFPQPGYIAEQVVFTRNSLPGSPPLVRVRAITCRASWFAVLSFTHRIDQMRLDTLQVFIPEHVPPPVRNDPATKIPTTVTELIADGAVLEVATGKGAPLRFDFSRLTVEEVARDKAMHFRTIMHNPKPPGEISADGEFGPISQGDAGRTPLSGSFSFVQADLSQFRGIAGLLSGKGDFKGELGRIEIRGQTEIPDFRLTKNRNRVHLTTEYSGIVNGLNGNVALQSVHAHLLRSVIVSRGSIMGETGRKGKMLSLDMDSHDARIQDLFRIFVKTNPAPVNGPISFRAHVTLPPESSTFLQKVQLEGDFGITDARFTRPATQEKVDKLSERTRGNKDKEHEADPKRLMSDLKGHVVLRRGIATFRNASFSVPGALARIEGTYNLLTEQIDLHGTLAMQASLSQAAGGIKSVLLKPFNRFFKKDGAGAVIPVRITGTYSHPIFAVSLKGKK